jgi:DNA-binding transcriptional LysR family regulator
MRTDDLARMDLNLLFVFEAVMQERSVTRAAQRLNVSQSTLKDELFIRGSGEMRPTPRAIALSTAVIPTLAHIRAALAPTDFNPAKAVHTFQIAMTDYAATLHLNQLVQTVRARAPNVDLRIKLNVMQNVWSLLDKQEADLVVGMIDQPPDRFATELLYEDGVVVVMSPTNLCRGQARLHSGRWHHANPYRAYRPRAGIEGPRSAACLDRQPVRAGAADHFRHRLCHVYSAPRRRDVQRPLQIESRHMSSRAAAAADPHRLASPVG